MPYDFMVNGMKLLLILNIKLKVKEELGLSD